MGKLREFGVGFLGRTFGIREIQRYTQLAEDNRFGSFWIAEENYFRGAFATAAGVAATTKTMRIGLGVVNPFSRHPALTAMELAALDEVSDGRAVLALGASVKEYMEDQLGIRYRKPRTAVKESVEIIRKLFHGERLNYSGELFRVSNFFFEFEPRRRQVPIYIGMMGSRGLELAGEIGDGVLLTLMSSPEYVRLAMERIRVGAARAGRTLDNFEVVAYLIVSVSPDGERARELVKPLIAAALGYFPPDPCLISAGLTLEQIRPFQEAVREGRFATELVNEFMIDKFAIAGSPGHCREALETLVLAGVQTAIVSEIPGANMAEIISNAAEYLLPHFQ